MRTRFIIISIVNIALIMFGFIRVYGDGLSNHGQHQMGEIGQRHADHNKHDDHTIALGEPAAVEAATRTIKVSMDDSMRFQPSRITIKQGETIRFVVHNQGQLKHEMVIDTMNELKEHAAMMIKFPAMEHDMPNAVSLPPGKSGEFAWTFTQPGKVNFACLVAGHLDAGMHGEIVVSNQQQTTTDATPTTKSITTSKTETTPRNENTTEHKRHAMNDHEENDGHMGMGGHGTWMWAIMIVMMAIVMF